MTGPAQRARRRGSRASPPPSAPIADADVRVPATAARHAVVFERDGAVVLLDSGSAEGTFLAGQLVQETDPPRRATSSSSGASGPRLRFEHDAPAALARAHPTLLAVPVETPSPARRLADPDPARGGPEQPRLPARGGGGGASWPRSSWAGPGARTGASRPSSPPCARPWATVEAERRALEQRVDAERRRVRRGAADAGAAHRGLPLARRGPAHASWPAAAAGEVQTLRDELGTHAPAHREPGDGARGGRADHQAVRRRGVPHPGGVRLLRRRADGPSATRRARTTTRRPTSTLRPHPGGRGRHPHHRVLRHRVPGEGGRPRPHQPARGRALVERQHGRRPRGPGLPAAIPLPARVLPPPPRSLRARARAHARRATTSRCCGRPWAR